MIAPAAPRAFAEPWHAQLFAMTVHLADRGLFTWPDWTARLSRRLAAARAPIEGGDDYYGAWMETLEGFLAEYGTAEAEVDRVTQAWASAYLTTPHSEPVLLRQDLTIGT